MVVFSYSLVLSPFFILPFAVLRATLEPFNVSYLFKKIYGSLNSFYLIIIINHEGHFNFFYLQTRRCWFNEFNKSNRTQI